MKIEKELSRPGHHKYNPIFRHIINTLILALVLTWGCLSESDNTSEDVMMPPPEVEPTPEPTMIPMPTQTFEPAPSPTAEPGPEPSPSPLPTIEPIPTVTPTPSPQPSPVPGDGLSDFAQTMLDLVNEARSESRFC